MGKTDMITKQLVSKKEIFADLFNTFVFHGEQVVQPEALIEQDSNGIYVDEDNDIYMQGMRDSLKLLKVMSDGKQRFMLLGIENQTAIHYAMPIRIMGYDFTAYQNQIKNTWKTKRPKKLTGEEYLSRFPKGETIYPVVTLVIYWGSDPWRGPRSLYDMFDEEILQRFGNIISDYKINILCPAELQKHNLIY